MSAELKTAIVNEAFDINSLYKQNCALKHGLERPIRREVGDAGTDPPPQVTVVNNIPKETGEKSQPTLTPGAVATPAGNSLIGRVAPFLLGAAAVGLPVGVASWKATPAPAPTPVVQPAPKSGSLLQYLEDNGYHREDGGQWTN